MKITKAFPDAVSSHSRAGGNPTLQMSFPRRRESRNIFNTLIILDSRFRGNDKGWINLYFNPSQEVPNDL